MRKIQKYAIISIVIFFALNAALYVFATDPSGGYGTYLKIIGMPSSLIFPSDYAYTFIENNKSNISHALRMMIVLTEYFIVPCVVDIGIVFLIGFGNVAIKRTNKLPS